MGHSDVRTTMMYTHVISEDSRPFAERLGTLLTTTVQALGTAQFWCQMVPTRSGE